MAQAEERELPVVQAEAQALTQEREPSAAQTARLQPPLHGALAHQERKLERAMTWRMKPTVPNPSCDGAL